jgi:hypothetical protein
MDGQRRTHPPCEASDIDELEPYFSDRDDYGNF